MRAYIDAQADSLTRTEQQKVSDLLDELAAAVTAAGHATAWQYLLAAAGSCYYHRGATPTSCAWQLRQLARWVLFTAMV